MQVVLYYSRKTAVVVIVVCQTVLSLEPQHFSLDGCRAIFHDELVCIHYILLNLEPQTNVSTRALL